jgi:hypothetical protein
MASQTKYGPEIARDLGLDRALFPAHEESA